MRRTLPIAAFAILLSTAFAGDHKKGPDDIGNSQPGKGVNFYSIEKEIALGKQMAQEVERQAKLVERPNHRGIR